MSALYCPNHWLNMCCCSVAVIPFALLYPTSDTTNKLYYNYPEKNYLYSHYQTLYHAPSALTTLDNLLVLSSYSLWPRRHWTEA